MTADPEITKRLDQIVELLTLLIATSPAANDARYAARVIAQIDRISGSTK